MGINWSSTANIRATLIAARERHTGLLFLFLVALVVSMARQKGTVPNDETYRDSPVAQ